MSHHLLLNGSKLNKTIKFGFIRAIKLKMKKAYDKLKWDFIRATGSKVDFHSKWIG